MKRLLLILILGFASLTILSREPLQNYEEILEKGKLKHLKTMFYRSEDTTESKGRLLFSKDLDREGKVLKKYRYTFWDVVSYDHTTTYKYNEEGRLAEMLIIQKIFCLIVQSLTILLNPMTSVWYWDETIKAANLTIYNYNAAVDWEKVEIAMADIKNMNPVHLYFSIYYHFNCK